MFNVGIDFQLFNGRLGGTIEYYDKKTSDMLYRYKVPTPTYVYSTIQANVGDMSNKGIEVMLNLDVIRNKTFNWNTSINLSHNKTRSRSCLMTCIQQAVFIQEILGSEVLRV